MRKILIAATLAFSLVATPALAAAKQALVITGIMGAWLAPLTEEVVLLKKQGYTVTVASYLNVPKVSRSTKVFGHSRGADLALQTGAANIVTADPTLLNPGCPAKSKCTNIYNPMNALLIVCCGGYPVRNATNVKSPYDHLSIPRKEAARIVKLMVQ